MTWDILISTIPHRHEGLCRILAEIDRQWQSGLGVIVLRDNLQLSGKAAYFKWQALTEMSRADYISIAADDDAIATDFVTQVMWALAQDPDYVGFPVQFDLDGERYVPRCEHSLRYGGWGNDGQPMYRDLVWCNPIRRELALLTSWTADSMDQDAQWAARLRATGKVRTEVWIPDIMYYYLPSRADGFETPRTPFPGDAIPPLPQYHWLTVHDNV